MEFKKYSQKGLYLALKRKVGALPTYPGFLCGAGTSPSSSRRSWSSPTRPWCRFWPLSSAESSGQGDERDRDAQDSTGTPFQVWMQWHRPLGDIPSKIHPHFPTQHNEEEEDEGGRGRRMLQHLSRLRGVAAAGAGKAGTCSESEEEGGDRGTSASIPSSQTRFYVPESKKQGGLGVSHLKSQRF